MKQLLTLNSGTTINLPPKRNYCMDYIPNMVYKEITEARLLINQGEFSAATELLLLSLQIWRSPIAMRLLGDINIQTKQYKKAQNYYKEAYSYFNFEPRFVQNNLLLYLTLNDRNSALNEFKHFKKIAPDHPAIKHLTPMLNAN